MYSQVQVKDIVVYGPNICLGPCVDLVTQLLDHIQGLPRTVHHIFFEELRSTSTPYYYEAVCGPTYRKLSSTPGRLLGTCSGNTIWMDDLTAETLFHEQGHSYFDLLKSDYHYLFRTWCGLYRSVCQDLFLPSVREGKDPISFGDEYLASYAFVTGRPLKRGSLVCAPRFVERVKGLRTVPPTECLEVQVVHSRADEFFCEAFALYHTDPKTLRNKTLTVFDLMQLTLSRLKQYQA